MNPTPPTWRIWLVTILAIVWGILAISSFTRGDSAIGVLSLVLFAWNAYQLWVFTRGRRD